MILLQQQQQDDVATRNVKATMNGNDSKETIADTRARVSDRKNIILEGNKCVQNNEFDKALQLYGQAISQKKPQTRQDLVELFSILNNIGFIYRKKGFYKQALETYEWSLRIKKRLFGLKSVEMIATINNIGTVHFNCGNYTTALCCYDEVLKLTRLHFGANTIQEGRTLNNIAWVRLMLGSFSNALESFAAALENFRTNHLEERDLLIQGALDGMQQARTGLKE